MRAIHGPERGTSIVELLIGIAIGLFIAAGATLLLTSQIGDTRRLLLEAQVQQDLRAAADLMSRDLRRAGYWGNAYRHVWAQTAADVSNPYQDATSLGTTGLVYSRSIDEETGPLGVDAGVVGGGRKVGRPRLHRRLKHLQAEEVVAAVVGGGGAVSGRGRFPS